MQSHPWHTNTISVSIILTALLLFRVRSYTVSQACSSFPSLAAGLFKDGWVQEFTLLSTQNRNSLKQGTYKTFLAPNKVLLYSQSREEVMNNNDNNNVLPVPAVFCTKREKAERNIQTKQQKHSDLLLGQNNHDIFQMKILVGK